ncbi:hypothetical protein GOBAR_DD27556 [Gossypium barbadense]|nr:hypothetical protein GOBAR_DD27556 [Gossypium barbadense]
MSFCRHERPITLSLTVLTSHAIKKIRTISSLREISLGLDNVRSCKTDKFQTQLLPATVRQISVVLETLSALDRAIHSPHAATQEVSTSVPRVTRASSGQYSDFSILSSLNSQLFESSALMHISAVKSLLSALCQLSHQCMLDTSSGFGPSTSQKIGSISFSVERMISILVNNLHRVLPLWDQVVGHFLELADNSNQHLRNMALDALDQSICAVLGSENEDHALSRSDDNSQDLESNETELRLLESAVISPLRVLFSSSQSIDVRAGSLKILLHVLERCGEKLRYCWPDILELLRSVADASEKDLVTLGFQSLRVIMNDGLSSIPPDYLNVCIDVTGAYGAQKTELNISLTAIGLLWTTTDFIVKGLSHESAEEKETEIMEVISVSNKMDGQNGEEQTDNISVDMNSHSPSANMVDRDKLIVSVFSLLQKLGADERPEVRLTFLFSDEEGNWSLTRSEVSKLVIMVLMMRCECILNRFLADEKDVGDRPLPTVRLEEVIFVLQELARLVIHSDTASVLPLNPHLRSTLAEGSSGKQPHLLVLFPSLSELVVSREGRVRELVKDLLKLIAKELTLEKVNTGC